MTALRTYSFPIGSAVLAACIFLFSGSSNADTYSGNNIPTGATTPVVTGTEVLQSFTTILTGAQETPAISTAAQGTGTATLNTQTRFLTATVVTAGINGTVAHIHEGSPGVSGPIAFPLNETSPGSGIWTTKVELTEGQANLLKGGNMYFNVHSATFPNGEIRGQILLRPSQIPTNPPLPNVNGTEGGFTAILKGSQQIPPATTAGHGAGSALVISPERLLIAAITTAGVEGNQAHIHLAPSGSNGPIIFPMMETVPGSGTWFTKVSLTEEQQAALKNGNMYFNVHSTAFPDGEIRGQILPVGQSGFNIANVTVTGNRTQITTMSTTTGTIGN